VRTAPWVRDITSHYSGRGLATIGVHAPEFEYERDRESVARQARKLGLDFPHLVDPDFEYWRALENEYWPTVYLIDRCGRVRGRRIGEIHAGSQSGRPVEALLEQLLAERDDCGD
jgi:hypothetical protein